MGANSARSSQMQLGHGIMSGATLLAHTDLALTPSAPPSLGPGVEDGRSVGRGLDTCCDSCMHCLHLHGCSHPSRVSYAALLQRWQPKRSKQYAMTLHIKGPKH